VKREAWKSIRGTTGRQKKETRKRSLDLFRVLVVAWLERSGKPRLDIFQPSEPTICTPSSSERCKMAKRSVVASFLHTVRSRVREGGGTFVLHLGGLGIGLACGMDRFRREPGTASPLPLVGWSGSARPDTSVAVLRTKPVSRIPSPT